MESIMFSSRTNWHRQPNRLSQSLDERRRSGKLIFDLTISNPTEAGIEFPSEEILSAIAQPQSLLYTPDPKGLLSAREAIAEYYFSKRIDVHPSQIVLTASTSEAYSFLFTLLCKAGDDVLIPTPAYPLFEFLSQLNHVHLKPYHLRYDGEWHIDVDSVRRTISSSTKAIVVINPHNPTGMFLKREERRALSEVCQEKNLALIVDEVFVDYGLQIGENIVGSTAGNSSALTFTLNGISKLCGLPQLKLGWIVVSGSGEEKSEALHRLEIIADTFLSVNTPVQVALPQLLKSGEVVRQRIRERVETNLYFLKNSLSKNLPISLLESEGGWYAILKIPNTKSEEEWVLQLLDEAGVYVFPGYFFEFQESGYLILSLLTTRDVFEKGTKFLFSMIAAGHD
jgi:aspartate/methionine/tyrosine aminotransferase